MSEEQSEESEKEELFSAVLSALNRDQLPLLARDIIQRLQPKSQPVGATPTVGGPLYGSYHALFPLIFDNGLHWLAKVPINGTVTKWDELSADSLASEAKTMRLLKRETTIPLPDVLDFSSTTENPLRCPYIIMTFVSGMPLYDVWFGERNGASSDATRLRRTRALEDIASAMVQLEKFSFSTGGRLLFGEDERPSGIGPMRKVDKRAMLERWFIHQDPDNDHIYIECAASSSQKTCYTPMLDKYPEQDSLSKGLAILLRQLIDWIPEPENMEPFVIAHPDFDIQNFIVSEEGELKGIIDWGGVTAVPRTIGNERYPGWLTRDWDPGMYGYTEEMEQNGESESVWEDSPKSLAYYRGIYDAAMMKRLVEREGSESRVNLCRMSLITENLAIAAEDPACRDPILEKVVSEIYTVTGQDDPLDFIEVANMFVEGSMDGAVMDTLHRGFMILLSKAGL